MWLKREASGFRRGCPILAALAGFQNLAPNLDEDGVVLPACGCTVQCL